MNMGFSYVDFIINNKELAAICKKYNLPVDIEGDVVKARCFPDGGLPETYYENRENELGNIALWFANVIVEGVFESDDDFNDESEHSSEEQYSERNSNLVYPDVAPRRKEKAKEKK